MTEPQWRKPSTDITNYHYTVILFMESYEDLEGEERESLQMDFFIYNTLQGLFYSLHGCREIRFKDIVRWYPVPEIPRELNENSPCIN